MGRSGGTQSCFKLITCGGGGNDSVDRDDLEAPESKGSSDRSRWSFRKRSARHRVLSNSVASEAPSVNKASPESAITGFPTQGSSTTPEKNSAIHGTEEKSLQEIPVDSKLSERTETIADNEDDKRADGSADEGSVIIIQAAIRRFLAQRILVKHKNIIKLQAAVRGHIVRRHAVGSLRCVQAIVKMQNLVRYRRARLLLEGSSIKAKGKENTGTKPVVMNASIEKLLSNGFARQLLESTPKTKTINIKCDPLKPDSAWRWLERWMSVSSTETGQSHGLGSNVEQQAKGNIEEADSHLETVIASPENCQSRDETNTEALPVPLEADNVITYDVDNYKFQECRPMETSAGPSIDQFHPQNIGEANLNVGALDSPTGHARELDAVSKIEPDSFNGHSEIEHRQNIPILDTPGVEGSENDGKKSSIGSRKASSPAFVAAQAKFEELSSAASLGKSVSSSNQDVSVDSSWDADLLVVNHASRTNEIDHAESSLSLGLGGQVNGSECGTELSISSTLDSPDRSEGGVVDSKQETKSSEEAAHYSKNDYNLEVEEKIESKILESDLSYSNSIVHEIDDSSIVADSEHVSSIMAGDSAEEEQKPATTATTDVHVEQKIETSHPVSGLSPEASPKSHVTVPESQETPSSQVSIKSKKSKIVKNGSNHKRVPTAIESSLEPNQENGARNRSEQLPKEHKNGKRRNSFGPAKTDHSDQEPRDSSSSNSVPSYMQATESARAKALSHSSPRSSPDMQDKDLYIRKRHSLPGASTRQGSPRVHRAQQEGAKGNGTHSPQERKWRR